MTQQTSLKRSTGHPERSVIAGVSALVVVVSRTGPEVNKDLVYQLRRITSATSRWIRTGGQSDGLKAKYTENIEVVVEPSPGLVAGRHRALDSCDADVLVYLDDDVTLPSGWVDSILEPFEDPEIHFVGCRYLPDYEHAPPPWLEELWGTDDDGFRELAYLSLLDGGETSRPYRPMLVWGLGFAVRRETLIMLGGFHPDSYPWELRRFRGDGESGLATKAERLGLRAFYQGKTYVNHQVPASRMKPWYFERRAFLQGISDSYTQIRRDGRFAPAQETSWKDLMELAKWKIERELILRRPSVNGVRALIARAYSAGAQYHQHEVRSDSQLLKWVLKADYFDYQLPNGWQRYLGSKNA